MLFAIAAAPNKLELFKSLITIWDSFPAFPRASQKLYWSIIVSPITRTFIFKTIDISFIFSKSYFFICLI